MVCRAHPSRGRSIELSTILLPSRLSAHVHRTCGLVGRDPSRPGDTTVCGRLSACHRRDPAPYVHRRHGNEARTGSWYSHGRGADAVLGQRTFAVDVELTALGTTAAAGYELPPQQARLAAWWGAANGCRQQLKSVPATTRKSVPVSTAEKCTTPVAWHTAAPGGDRAGGKRGVLRYRAGSAESILGPTSVLFCVGLGPVTAEDLFLAP